MKHKVLFLSFLIASAASSQTLLGVAIDVRGTDIVVPSGNPNNMLGYEGYAYAPSIIQDGDYYHMFYCSTGNGTDTLWDYVRHSVSRDGVVWSKPNIVITPSHLDAVNGERCACDPSVVKFGGQWYLYYGGNHSKSGGEIYVAKSNSLWGGFAKLSKRGTWENNPPDPKPIISPTIANSNTYGAGQPSAVVINGTIHIWYTDNSAYNPSEGGRRHHTSSTDGTNFTAGTEITVMGAKKPFEADNGEVKWSPKLNKYLMFDMNSYYGPGPQLGMLTSVDGLDWTAPQSLGVMPDYSFNIGVSGDALGWVDLRKYFVSMGVPWDYDGNANPSDTHRWNLVSVAMAGSFPKRSRFMAWSAPLLTE